MLNLCLIVLRNVIYLAGSFQIRLSLSNIDSIYIWICLSSITMVLVYCWHFVWIVMITKLYVWFLVWFEAYSSMLADDEYKLATWQSYIMCFRVLLGKITGGSKLFVVSNILWNYHFPWPVWIMKTAGAFLCIIWWELQASLSQHAFLGDRPSIMT